MKRMNTYGTGQERIKLEESDLEKDLGIYIDPNLNFKKTYKKYCKKIKLYQLQNIKKLYFQKS